MADQTKLVSGSGYDLTPPTPEQFAELTKDLSPLERHVLLNHGTEASFCGTLLNNKKDGVYHCRICDLPLFTAGDKFESGTGWPSFSLPYDDDHIAEIMDRSHGMVRVEIRCKRCDGHLGHVFDDGPRPSGKRYCLNSVSMTFKPK